MNMSEAKPIASLSSVLLARKGAARPAMRRQTMNGMSGAAAVAQDDLGWNDMGYDVDPDQSAPMEYQYDAGYNPLANAVPEVKPEVKVQQDRIAEQLNVQAEETPALHYDEEPASILDQISAQVTPFAAVEPEAIEPVVAEQPAPAVVTVPVAVSAPVSVKPKAPRAAPGLKGKSAFTLRLDGERHLRLRLACAVSNRSAQQLVTAALDAFIDSMPEIGALASQLPATKRNAE
jgi:hypothetical protein